jgi:hypothetical protein
MLNDDDHLIEALASLVIATSCVATQEKVVQN